MPFGGICSTSLCAAKQKPWVAVCIQETFGGAILRGVNDAVCPVLILRSRKLLLTHLIYIRLGAGETLEDFHSFNKSVLSLNMYTTDKVFALSSHLEKERDR